MDTPQTSSSCESYPNLSKTNKLNMRSNSNRSCYAKDIRADTNCTPCPLQKVNNWINCLQQDDAISNDGKDEDEIAYPIEEGMFKNRYNYHHFEHDYSTDKLSKMQIMKYKFLKKDYEEDLFAKRNNEQKDANHKLKILQQQQRGCKSVNKEFESLSINHNNSKLHASPENEKKRELCNYLQLMKPNDKKNTGISKFTNRRSARVKNLAQFNKLKNKSNDTPSSKSNCSDTATATAAGNLNSSNSIKVSENNEWSKYRLNPTTGKRKDYDNKILSSSSTSSVSVPKVFVADSQNNNNSKAMDASQNCYNFSIPKPSKVLFRAIHHFDDVIKENAEFYNVNNNIVNNGKTKNSAKRLISRNKEQPKNKSLKRKPLPKGDFKRVTRSSKQSLLISEIIYSLRNRSKKQLVIPLKRMVPKKIHEGLPKKKLKRKTPVTKQQISKPSQNENVQKIEENCENEAIINVKDLSNDLCKLSNSNDNYDLLNFNDRQYADAFQNFVSDADFSSLTLEHKKSLWINKASMSVTRPLSPIFAIYNKQSNSNVVDKPTSDKNEELQKADSIIIKQYEVTTINNVNKQANSTKEPSVASKNDVDDNKIKELSPSPAETNRYCITPVLPSATALVVADLNPSNSSELLSTTNKLTNWSTTDTPGPSPEKSKKNRHSINISNENGKVLKSFYLKHNLVLCQELLVSFWTQTALGSVLGAQNMWIHKGNVQRITVNANCTFKESLEMVVSTDNNLAYIELWTQEHESELRERPVADIFAIIYFWKKGQSGLDKKVLQLENIKGFADDVQYCVLQYYPKIIVSWFITNSELGKKQTHIFHYHLAADYQTVDGKSEFGSIEHYVSSLHTIEDGETIIAGCGENKITLWNIEDGYILATVEMLEIKSPLCTLWVKCDRGFLFTLQQCVDRELRLIAIHGKDYSWKKLASYTPPKNYDRLNGVCIENGVILAFYNQGIVCWKSQTAEIIIEESSTNDSEFISGKYVISVVSNGQVNIRHMLTYLLCSEES